MPLFQARKKLKVNGEMSKGVESIPQFPRVFRGSQ
jgi:hypothetical protein